MSDADASEVVLGALNNSAKLAEQCQDALPVLFDLLKTFSAINKTSKDGDSEANPINVARENFQQLEVFKAKNSVNLDKIESLTNDNEMTTANLLTR